MEGDDRFIEAGPGEFEILQRLSRRAKKVLDIVLTQAATVDPGECFRVEGTMAPLMSDEDFYTGTQELIGRGIMTQSNLFTLTPRFTLHRESLDAE